MGKMSRMAALLAATGLVIAVSACGGGGGGGGNPPPATTYVLTVNSTNPASGVAIAASPSDTNNAGNGTTSFTRTYNAATTVTLTAPATSGGSKFTSWGGCATAAAGNCTVTMTANTTVTASYTVSPITSVTVTPNPATATIGTQLQFAAVVSGNGSFDHTVKWSVLGPPGSALSAGSISASGLYTTPYPAPASVTVAAASNQDPTVSGSVVVPLSPPVVAPGPALSVDAGNQTHPINPMIYGMNGWSLDVATATAVKLPVDRWGGDYTSLYNYQLDVSNNASDWYFENSKAGTGVQDTGAFNAQVANDAALGAKTMGTVPLLGWAAKDGSSCSYSVAKYGAQKETDPYRADCGKGVLSNGQGIVNDPTDTSTPIDAAFVGGWVKYLVGKFGAASKGGVAIFDLDNEPSWWDAVHKDMHPQPFTYDEVTARGLTYAKAIKDNDPTAEVSGPVMDYWWDYFYSKKDVESGWGSGSPCWAPWSNPVDRNAHNGIPLIEYYLRQFRSYEDTNHVRLLDYVDLHTYFVASYQGASLGFATAGDTGAQQARLNSTRVFWDPTYTDPNLPQPNYTTDANYTANCSTPLQAPRVIPMMRDWVANDYPGTKLAITEYNWGGLEHINGALAQADILGIFGREGLDIGTLWGPPQLNPPAPQLPQVPGVMAFEIFRNYDGAGAQFGDIALASTSVDEGKLAVYGALRRADNQLTIVVINKTYGDLSTILGLANLTPNGPTKVFQYSAAHLAGIVAQPDLTVTPPSGGGATSTLSTTFPAQSITVLVVPKV